MKRNGRIVSTSLLAMVMVLAMVLTLSVMPVGAQDPWEGYLVPQNSTGSYGTDTLVELWANVTTDQVWGYQADLYFDTSCVNVTDITYTSAFPNVGWSWNDVGGGRAFVRFYGDRGGSGNLPPGIYHLATATLHGESPTYCVSDLEWQNHLVSDDNGDPITNSYTDGTYTCGTPPVPEWPQFHYDIANTGNSPSNAPDNNITKWISDNIGAVASSQAMIVGDKVFVYANDTVYALNKMTGREEWSTSIPGDTQAWGSWASPAYDDDMLFVSAGYNLTKLNATTGVKLQEIAFPDGGYSCNGGPTVADGMVFAGSGSGGNYYAFDESDLNTVVWTYATPTGGSAVSTPAVAAGKVVVGEMTWGGASVLSCIDETTGTVGSPGTWTTTLVGDVGGSAAIDVANNRVYVATFVDYTGDIGRLYALNFTTGAEVWNQTITYSDSTPAISGDLIYVSGSTNAPGVTYCFNQAGVLQWDVPCGSWTMSPAVADGKLFTGRVGTDWGAVDGICVFDATTGTPLWNYDDAGSSPSVAESDGIVVSIGNDGKVYAFGTPEEVGITVDAPDECIPRQSQFHVDIKVDPKGAIPVYSAQYTLSFDPTVLRAETQVKGPFLTADGEDSMVVINRIDNDAGKIEYSETRKDTTTGVTAEGVLATITFTAIGDTGTSSDLNLSVIIISNPDVEPLRYSITNDSVSICKNEPPVANATVYDDYNNVGSKYLCKVYFNASGSHDPDGNITYYRWDFGDGDYGTGMIKEHVYTSWNWDNTTGYEPFHASLTVTDNTPEPETKTNTTYFDVTIYIAGDANGDGVVNILDASMIGLEWMHTCNPPSDCWRDTTYDGRADRADLNNDHVVNILDAVIVGTCWKHTAWGTV